MKKATKAGFIICAGMLGVALGVAIVFAVDRPPAAKPDQPSPFRIVKTSDSSIGAVKFQITNEGKVAIVYAAVAPQVKSNGHWIESPLLLARPATLAPRQAGAFIASSPTNNFPWRVPVVWSYPPTRLQLWKSRAQNFLLRQNKGLRVENYVVYSPEVRP